MSNAKKMTSGIDASLPLTKDNVDLFYTLHKSVRENIKQNVRMLLLTAPGERIMIPDYGVGLRRFLFEQAPESEIAFRIKEQVNFFIPEIFIVNLFINRDDEREVKMTGQKNMLSVEMIYQITNTNIRDVVRVVDTITG